MGAPLVQRGLTRRVRVMLAVALLVLAAATVHRLLFADLPGPIFEFAGPTMGTTFVVKVAAPSMSPGTHEEIARTLTDRLKRVNGMMSTWDPDSEISRFNRHAGTDPFPVSPETARVMAVAREVSERSGGAFDVTVRPLVQAWGFGEGAKVPGGPSEEELAALRERVGWRRVRVGADGRSLVKTRPDVTCDLSAIAKGYAVDALSDDLLRLGFRDHLVEVGGELRARGRKPGGEPWRVAIETPRSEGGRSVFDVLLLDDLGMATSGDYRNYYERDGVRISHTIDPRDGRPIRHGLASVTVLHPETMWADAWATALDVLGPEAGFDRAEAEGLPAYFIVREPGGGFESRETSKLVTLRAATP